MPICQTCHGSGQKEVRVETKKTCPKCNGSKNLPDGSDCPRCKKLGKIATGKYKRGKELCDTCWGSGEVSQMSVNIWFALRAVPTSLFLLFGGPILAFGAWQLIAFEPVSALIIIIAITAWGILMNGFIRGLLNFGPVPQFNWFLMRAGVASIAVLTVGFNLVWILFFVLTDPRQLSLAGLAVLGVWAMWMFVLIIFDHPKSDEDD
ncbi:hypothetical protein QUF63_07190 [Anaerolineales bacterium HSG25]|nr:hypothetical protein [Anaerolineales bacterium HSG25]